MNTGKRKEQKASQDEPRSIRYGMPQWVLGNNISSFDPRSPSLFVFPTTSYATTNDLLVLAWVVAKLKRLQGVPLSLLSIIPVHVISLYCLWCFTAHKVRAAYSLAAFYSTPPRGTLHHLSIGLKPVQQNLLFLFVHCNTAGKVPRPPYATTMTVLYSYLRTPPETISFLLEYNLYLCTYGHTYSKSTWINRIRLPILLVVS